MTVAIKNENHVCTNYQHPFGMNIVRSYGWKNRTAAFTAARVYHHEEEKTFLCNKIIFFKYREEVLYDTKKFSYLLDLSIDILRYLVYLYK